MPPVEPISLPVLNPVVLAYVKGLLLGCGFGIALCLAVYEIAEAKRWMK